MKKFVKKLKDFRLHLPTNIEIKGEAAPYIKKHPIAKKTIGVVFHCPGCQLVMN